MSYDDIKVPPAYKFVGIIIVLLTFSHQFGVREYVDEWVLSHFKSDSARQLLLVGWKTAVLTAFIGVGAVYIYWKSHGPSNSPLKVEKEGHPNSPSARQKTFSEKLGTSLLLVLSLFPLWLSMTFFLVWTM